MHKSDLALELLEKASKASSREEAFELAYQACLSDPKNGEAHIILARLSESFEEKEMILRSLDTNARVRYELGCLYLNEAMFRRAINCFVSTLEIESSRYYLLNALAYIEDDRIAEIYEESIKEGDEKCFGRCALPYLVYLFKTGAYKACKELYKEILAIDPSFVSLFKGGDGSDEAKRIMKNNAALISSTPALIEWLNAIEEEDHD